MMQYNKLESAVADEIYCFCFGCRSVVVVLDAMVTQ